MPFSVKTKDTSRNMGTDTGSEIRKEIFQTGPATFTETALKTFRFQWLHNKIYRSYCELLRVVPDNITNIKQIPFLPVQFFKTNQITTGEFDAALVFESSGTSGSVNAKHFVKEKGIYEESFLKCFRENYGDEKELCIIGLLPSYLERNNSSLVYMVQELIRSSGHERSGFYLDEYEKLQEVLLKNEQEQQPTLLIGVTYALIDFAEKHPMELRHTIIMETGGMKGRREELSRKEVHSILKTVFSIDKIHSEYGMTELLSQAYSHGEGIFNTPSWMKILLRSEDDPFEIADAADAVHTPLTGAVNIIDLANLYSCCFIATDDMGKLYSHGSFEINGRLDNSDIRGCGLMLI